MSGRLFKTTLLGLGLAAVAAPAAPADGLPVLGVDVGSSGVTAPAVNARYVTLHAGKNTIVARVERNGGRIFRSMTLPGSFTVPAVAFDGSSSGLSADGSTLVLIRPRITFPRARTPLVILDARTLRVRRVVRLRGDFSFDAISPDGARLYLIEYTSPTDPTHYAVRAFDIAAARLLAAPVVDPREPDEAMRGLPITRAMSPDGRWAYTLYDGYGMAPFVHALDTVRNRAVCIDLGALAGRNDLYALKLAVGPGGRNLTVHHALNSLLVIDTRTFRVTKPAVATPAAGGDGLRRPLVGAAAVAALLAAAALSLVLRRRRLIPT
jgi:DNA-binding beta-propeller fold protein YncE